MNDRSAIDASSKARNGFPPPGTGELGRMKPVSLMGWGVLQRFNSCHRLDLQAEDRVTVSSYVQVPFQRLAGRCYTQRITFASFVGVSIGLDEQAAVGVGMFLATNRNPNRSVGPALIAGTVLHKPARFASVKVTTRTNQSACQPALP